MGKNPKKQHTVHLYRAWGRRREREFALLVEQNSCRPLGVRWFPKMLVTMWSCKPSSTLMCTNVNMNVHKQKHIYEKATMWEKPKWLSGYEWTHRMCSAHTMALERWALETLLVENSHQRARPGRFHLQCLQQAVTQSEQGFGCLQLEQSTVTNRHGMLEGWKFT